MTDQSTENHMMSIRAEQAVLGALLVDNDAFDRVSGLTAAHFVRHDHQVIFAEICRQILANRGADPVILANVLHGKVDDCLRYLAKLRASAVSAARIKQHADIVIDRANKRHLHAISIELAELAASNMPAEDCVVQIAARLDGVVQAVDDEEPERLEDVMVDYLAMLEARMEGTIQPIRTGYRDLDRQLDGGLERGTLTVVAARPGMGKTAFGMGIARNVASDSVAMFFSMEMSRMQVGDRNVSAIGGIPLRWLRRPGDSTAPTSDDQANWRAITEAVTKARDINLILDYKTGLNTAQIRAKARKTKRKHGGLDLIVIDQLSFITGGTSEKSYEAVGEHTRALVALAKELDCAVILLCQLNRECEKRPNKRPIMADLAMSGSIEQDAANIFFLYRDEKYHPDTTDPGICEVNCEKLRQGEPGIVGLKYIGRETRFENPEIRWQPRREEPSLPAYRPSGFGQRRPGVAA